MSSVAQSGAAASIHWFSGECPAMTSIERVVDQIAPSECPFLIVGAQGTGKHALALRIYELSGRVHSSFLELTCADTPRDAFHPDSRYMTCGSLYLDEVTELRPEHQAALVDIYFSPSSNWTKLPRLIAATADEMSESLRGTVLNELLFDSLSAVTLRLPALHQRASDIIKLAEYFISSYAYTFGRPQPQLTEDSIQFFLEYAWPGNLDELEAATKTLVALGDARAAIAALRASALHLRVYSQRRSTSLKLAGRAASQQAERALIAEVLQQTAGNRKQAARQLQISYKALLYKLKQNGLSASTPSTQEEGEQL